MRKIIMLVGALLFAHPASAAESVTLEQVNAHLASVKTLTADFVQTGQDGARAKGKMVLSKPGRIRFEYEPSVPLLVVANGKVLSMIDYEVNQVSRWPIKETPLSILLDPTSDLSKYAEVIDDGASPPTGIVTVRAVDPEHPEYGTILLYFARNDAAPGDLVLAGWHVIDAQGVNTRIQLADVRLNVPVESSSFTYRDPRPKTRPRGKTY